MVRSLPILLRIIPTLLLSKELFIHRGLSMTVKNGLNYLETRISFFLFNNVQ